MEFLVVGLVAALVALMIYIRVAPSRASRWHDAQTPSTGLGAFPAISGHIEQLEIEGDGATQMAALDKIIRATPRTMGLAGTLESGKMTYVTRSAFFGFPDYTTVSLLTNNTTGQVALQVFGRLRFGRKDFGVNRKRIELWLAQLDVRDGTDTPDA